MRYRRSILMTGLITSAALWGIAAHSQNASSPTAQDFVTKATVAGKTEVAAGRVALKTSQSDDVKTFAKQMIRDHTKAGNELASLAKGQNLAVPTHIDAQHRAVLGSLRAQTGAAFDAAYSKQMVADHAEAVASGKKRASAM